MLLALLQVKANDDVPLYWYRAEHIEDYKSLVAEPHPGRLPAWLKGCWPNASTAASPTR